MDNKIHVGNLSYSTQDASLHKAFSEFGDVNSAKVVLDRTTDQSKGFGFVEMGSAAQAQAAIQALHGTEIDGRSLTVSLARPMTPRHGAGGH